MHISTIDEEFEYQIKEIVKEMRRENEELSDLSAEEFQDKLWKDDYYCKEFAHKVINRAYDWAEDEIFE